MNRRLEKLNRFGRYFASSAIKPPSIAPDSMAILGDHAGSGAVQLKPLPNTRIPLS